MGMVVLQWTETCATHKYRLSNDKLYTNKGHTVADGMEHCWQTQHICLIV
jgi:hypothetical protein